jgi:hypothetical protein
MLVPINITGPVDQNRANFLSSQKTLGFYPEATKSGFVLHSFPGLKSFSVGNGGCRGATVTDKIYQVSGSGLYSINSAGDRTYLGTIPGSGRVIFSGIGSNIVIVSSGIVSYWNGTILSTVTDIDLETPNSATHLNNQVIYDGDGGRWASSDVGDATSINGLNYATAESDQDNLLRGFAYDQLFYAFGTKTIEPWWNSGTGKPPFDRLQTIMQIGLGALHSLAANDTGMYFLGDDKNIYFLKGTSYRRVSTIAIANEIEGFGNVEDAEGSTFTYQGQNFYLITFPSVNRTLVLNESLGENGWFELSSAEDLGTPIRYLASSFVFFNGKNYVTDVVNGNIYELSTDVFSDAGQDVLRIRDTGTFHGGLIKAPGKRISMSRFELIMETGVGTTEDPSIVLQISDDGGRTFSNEYWGTVGRSGEFIWKVQWHNLGSFFNRIIRIKTSGQFFWSIHSAAADIEVGL